MRVLTKLKIYGLVGAAIVAATWIFLFDPTVQHSSNEDMLILTVIFEPAVRTTPISIVAGVDGHPSLSEVTLESPWSEPVHAHRGSVVTLTAVQHIHGQILTCTIKNHRGTFGPEPAVPTPNGKSSCFVTAIA